MCVPRIDRIHLCSEIHVFAKEKQKEKGYRKGNVIQWLRVLEPGCLCSKAITH